MRTVDKDFFNTQVSRPGGSVDDFVNKLPLTATIRRTIMLWLKNSLATSALAIFLLLGLSAQSNAMDNLEAIDTVRMNFNAASMASDALAVADLLDKDAVWVPAGQVAILGREAIKAFYVNRFTDKRTVITLHPGAIQLMGDWAVLHSTFSRLDADRLNREEQTYSGNYLWVLRKQPDGNWKVAYDIWNEVADE
ncbi:hypothetical protein C6366_15415 [Desulfonatronum sp. SC1]|nr:hypothetical protein C6366_15415 [Desulfonatronum sp. SC1]